jgi:hypothetical protein
MWYVRYEVVYLNEESEKSVESGLLCAASYTDATEKLEGFYGNDLVEIKLLRYVCDSSILLLSPEILDAIEEEAGDNV